MKDCCLDIWFETNLVIRMITWEHMRLEGDDASKSQDEFFNITYYCSKCKKRFGRQIVSYISRKDNIKNIESGKNRR